VPADQRKRKRAVQIIRALVSLGIVVAIFALILPKIASYSTVWKTLTSLRPLQIVAVTGAMVFNLFTYWWQMQAAMPGLTMGQAAVNNQTGTTISNVIPGGGVVSIGVVVEMFRSWGFTGSEIGLELSISGIWNSFLKLGLPIVALAILAITGKATAALLIPAVVGLLILAGCLLVFALMLWKKQFAMAIGNGLGRAWSWLRGLVHKPPVTTWGEGARNFRKATIKLVEKRWIPLTLTTVLSHLALFFVLLLSLRYLGVHEHEITWAQALAVFAFARLLSALPFTPGGLGVVELALIGGLYAAGRHHADVPLPLFKAQITAATLLFRTLTYGVQIPLGGFTYIIWRRNKRWRKQPVVEEPVQVPVPAVQS
jgi:putative heme transporter